MCSLYRISWPTGEPNSQSKGWWVIKSPLYSTIVGLCMHKYKKLNKIHISCWSLVKWQYKKNPETLCKESSNGLNSALRDRYVLWPPQCFRSWPYSSVLVFEGTWAEYLRVPNENFSVQNSKYFFHVVSMSLNTRDFEFITQV